MKLYTPEKGELLNVLSIESHPDGLLIQGKIMGAMPMRAILRPRELRASFGLLGPRLCWQILLMLLRRDR